MDLLPGDFSSLPVLLSPLCPLNDPNRFLDNDGEPPIEISSSDVTPPVV